MTYEHWAKSGWKRSANKGELQLIIRYCEVSVIFFPSETFLNDRLCNSIHLNMKIKSCRSKPQIGSLHIDSMMMMLLPLLLLFVCECFFVCSAKWKKCDSATFNKTFKHRRDIDWEARKQWLWVIWVFSSGTIIVEVGIHANKKYVGRNGTEYLNRK